MLKINSDNSLTVLLSGRHKTDYSLLFAGVLGVFALLVAYLAITQAVAVAIGGIFGLAVGCFFFNHYKEKLKNQPIIGETLSIRPLELSFGQTQLLLNEKPSVEITDTLLIVKHDNKTWQFAGFANTQELQIVQKVLMGQQIAGRKVSIKMGQS